MSCHQARGGGVVGGALGGRPSLVWLLPFAMPSPGMPNGHHRWPFWMAGKDRAVQTGF